MNFNCKVPRVETNHIKDKQQLSLELDKEEVAILNSTSFTKEPPGNSTNSHICQVNRAKYLTYRIKVGSYTMR